MIYKVVKNDVAKIIREGYLRIGSLNYYKHIEDGSRKDNLEGVPDKIIVGEDKKVVEAAEFNLISQSVGSVYRMGQPLKLNFTSNIKLKIKSDFNVHVFCTSIGSPEILQIKDGKSKFGEEVFEILDPVAFSRLVADALLVKYQDGELVANGIMDSVSHAHHKVIYLEEKDNKNYITYNEGLMNVNFDSVFTKLSDFETESEYRFIWFPYSNFKKMGCALPYNHEYLDIKIENLESYINWL